MARLNTTVHVYDEDGSFHAFGPGDEVPSKYADQVTAEGIWAEDGDAVPTQTAAATAPSTPAAAPASAGAAQDPAQGTSAQTPAAAGGLAKPPVVGTGSGRDPWFDYATKGLGLTVPDDAKKDAILQLVADYESAQTAQGA